MTLIYGHRGAKGEAPENTLTGFQECLKHGVRRCELDLHLSMDGELMVIHDPTLKRTTDRRGKVVEHTAAELVTYDARKGGPGWIKPCPIPRLEELFEKCDFEHWQLEVKSASRTRAAATVLGIREMAQRFGLLDKITITSSSREVLKAALDLTPDISRGLGGRIRLARPVEGRPELRLRDSGAELDPVHAGTPDQGAAPGAACVGVDRQRARADAQARRLWR